MLFFSSRGQKIKRVTKITKLEQMRLFLFVSLVSFFIVFLTQRLIYTINISFILLYFKIEIDVVQNLIDNFF